MISFSEGSILQAILTPLFGRIAYPVTSDHILIIGYAPIPWFGVMLLGFSLGKLFFDPEKKRTGAFLKAGVGCLLLYVAIRSINVYGDPVIWESQKNTVFSLLSFLNVTKYPPSLLFCLMTLGTMFLILALTESARGRIAHVLRIYGKVPLFYFIVHFYLIHTLLIIILLLQGFRWDELDFSGTMGRPESGQSGLPLWAVYLIWIGVVASMYLPCKWFGTLKAGQKSWWLRYL